MVNVVAKATTHKHYLSLRVSAQYVAFKHD